MASVCCTPMRNPLSRDSELIRSSVTRIPLIWPQAMQPEFWAILPDSEAGQFLIFRRRLGWRTLVSSFVHCPDNPSVALARASAACRTALR